jgi:hypothetical protein
MARLLRNRKRPEGLIVHKYKVGESVHYTSNVMRRFGATGNFRIVKLLPLEGDELQYRIKSATEPHERVAKESQLDQDQIAVDPMVTPI